MIQMKNKEYTFNITKPKYIEVSLHETSKFCKYGYHVLHHINGQGITPIVY